MDDNISFTHDNYSGSVHNTEYTIQRTVPYRVLTTHEGGMEAICL
jgi:hypothetical protein